MWLRNLGVGRRSALSFSLLAGLLLVLGAVALYQMNQMDDRSEEIDGKWLPAIMAVNDMTAASSRVRSMTLRYAVVEGTYRDSTLENLNRAVSALANSELMYKEMIASPEEEKLFRSYKTAKDNYLTESEKAISLVQSGKMSAAKEIIEERLGTNAEILADALMKLAEFNSKSANASSIASDETFANAVQFILGMVGIAIVLTLVLALTFTRTITVPLSQAIEASKIVASGDLTYSFDIQGRDEPAQLLKSLSDMRSNLRDTIEHIANSSTQLASASEELHAVTEDSTRGLHQQNAEIELAATAVNEMTSAVEEVAHNALSTSDASVKANQTARSGRDRVEHTVTSIAQLVGEMGGTSVKVEELANNVRDIGQVLSVIRSIAEQTNLLALNAAIEAARAGEQGRGFAVVADEVRALAHRTQQSTQEIEQMINTIQEGATTAVASMRSSRDRVDHTLEVARAAGAALDEIAQAISSINERNLVIASASEEQANVAREVDRNLLNIKDLSLQTSAGADQTSSASQELSRLAVDLNGIVRRFNI
ncbi:methyl-accepting chemotaxis protein [Pseudomonas taiwanensis]|uniref:Methyl-accepting chemotaxis protein n=1 Tax=Pseudomonas taiwanensis TaxID=470150 RepID=A0ABR6V5R3_9PSED|nr:methyl-accepting chemotaxis protein [Pseudomonas taiwanensis]MBC3475786.1 methyl-accepting chemotaxis protein [Pseudomonas taiwanensis]